MKQLQSNDRILLGMLIAPLAAPTAIFLFGVLYDLSTRGMSGHNEWILAAVIYYGFGLPVSYSAMLLLGFPYITWLKNHQKMSWFNICFGAAFVGAISLPVVSYFIGQTLENIAKNVLTGSLLGLVSGLVFCAVVPNKSLKDAP